MIQPRRTLTIGRGISGVAFAFLLVAMGLRDARASDQGVVVPAPRDIPYPGTVQLRVDATDLDRRIFRVHETIPVRPGALTLYYPRWLPGTHQPAGPIESLAGIIITAGGKRIDWSRDSWDVYAFHLRVPASTRRIDLEFEFLSPQRASPHLGVSVTPEMLRLDWNTVLLYPAGYFVGRMPVSASVTLPAGWSYGTALATERRDGQRLQFRTTSLETLVDSPLLAGKYFERLDLASGSDFPVHLDIVADDSEDLVATPAEIEAHRRLAQQALRLFGSRHFEHYDFLLSISDELSTAGLEHHQSSEDGVQSGYFTDWNRTAPGRFLLPHELVHSWNGKFRRPADLWTPNYNTAMGDSLLWVYEGLTNYWDRVLTGRSGLWTEALTHGSLASIAATFEEKRPGRLWRDLADTTNQPVIGMQGPEEWSSWERAQDYYNGALLVWLDVDVKIRALTGDKRSLDDFARSFFGRDDGRIDTVTYTFRDLVHSLNGIAPYDWAKFFQARLHDHEQSAPLDGLRRAGWKLAFESEPSEFTRRLDALNGSTDLSYSLGLAVNNGGQITEVVWGSPAFEAGLTTAATIIAVDRRAFSPVLLKRALQISSNSRTPVELLIRNFDEFRTVRLEYSDGPRYPHLERIPNTKDILSEILRPLGAGN